MFYSNLALHSLFNNRRQYTSLFFVCLVGVCLILSTVTITDGMFKTTRYKARQYYGGDLQFLCDNQGDLGIYGADEYVDTIRNFIDDDTKIFKRIDYDAQRCTYFFEGESVRQRVLKGVDFDDEKDLFADFKFRDGGAYSLPDHNTVIISTAIADLLAVNTGDEITLQCQSIYGSTNTMSLVVTGIFQDTSLFGMYTSYIDIRALRTLIQYPDNYVNRINICYKNTPSTSSIKRLQQDLSTVYNMYPLTEDKQEFYNAAYSIPEEVHALVTLDANIKELEVLIDAIKAVVILVTTIIVLIISIGIGSTYRVIVMKRITEIGTYRAIGMKPDGVTRLFIAETFFLLLSGFIAGIILTLIVNTVVGSFDLSFIPAFDVFLMQGKLKAHYNILKAIGLLAVIAVTTIAFVLFTVKDLVHISPVGALATTN